MSRPDDHGALDSRTAATRPRQPSTAWAGAPFGAAAARLSASLLVALSLAACGASGDAELAALTQRDWEARLADDPLFATSVGEHGRDGLLPDVSYDALARAAARDEALLAALQALAPSALTDEAADTRTLLLREVDGRLQRFRFGE